MMDDELELRVEERTRELSTLLKVSRSVASTLELEPLLGLILNKLVNTRRMRQIVVPDNIGPALLIHCAEEMNHLAGFLPALFHEMTGQITEE